MTKKFNSHDLLIIAILILLSVVVWIGTSAYHAFTSKKKTIVAKSILEKLDPRLNGTIIDTLAEKRHLEKEQLIKILSEIELVPIITPMPTPTPSLSPLPSPSPSVSMSPTLINSSP